MPARSRLCGNGSVWRYLSPALFFVTTGLTVSDAPAQSEFYLTPSISVTQVYDDNLFAAASQHEDDFITRITPALESGYRSERLNLEGRAEFDAEIYAEHEELDSSQARRHAALDISYEQTRRLTLEASGSYTRTNRPEEISPDSSLDLGRAEAERISLAPSAEYRFDDRTSGMGEYAFTRESLSGDGRIDTHAASLGFERRLTRRDTGGLGYTYRRFLFEGGDNVTAHVVDFGWARELTPRTSLSVHGGPRISDSAVDPEVMASIRHRLERGELAFTYARSQATVLGEDDTAETESYSGSLTYDLSRSFSISVAPSFQTNSSGGFEVDVYRLGVDARYELNRYLSIAGAWRYSFQQGTLDGIDEEIERNVVWLTLTLSYPPRRTSALPTAKSSAVPGVPVPAAPHNRTP